MTSTTVLIRGWIEMDPEVLTALEERPERESHEFAIPILEASASSLAWLSLSARPLAGAA